MDAPTSANVAPTPRARAGRPGPYTSSGTYSRVWSVPGIGGIAAVVGGDDQHVAGAEPGSSGAELAVERLQGRPVAGDVVAVAVEHVEIDQVGEDQPRAARPPVPRASRRMPSALPWLGRERPMPRPAKMFSILPMAVTATPFFSRMSRTVSPGGRMGKSRRLAVRLKFPGRPTKGRAMTRPIRQSSQSVRARRHISYSSGSGMTSSWAAIWKTLSAEV